MKLDYWHTSPRNNTRMDRPPILDWDFFYKRDNYVFKGGKFTGEFFKYAFFTLFILRHEFHVSVEWGHGKTTPELAKKAYHERKQK